MPADVQAAQRSEQAYSQADHAQIKAELGLLYRSIGEYERALDYFQAALALDTQARYWVELGWTHYLAQNLIAAQQAYAQAEQILAHRVERHGSTAEIAQLRRRLSYALKLAKNLPEAARALELVLLNSESAEDFLLLGQIYQLRERSEDARMAYLKAYALYREKQERPPIELAFGLKSSGERDVATELFRDFWQRRPRGEYALALASLSFPSQPEQSRSWLKKLDRFPLTAPLEHLEQAYLWLQLGEPQRAAELYQLALIDLQDERRVSVLLGAAQALQQAPQPVQRAQAAGLYQELAERKSELSDTQRAAVAYGLMQFQNWGRAVRLLESIEQPSLEQRLLLAQSLSTLGREAGATQLYGELAQSVLRAPQTLGFEQQRAVLAGLLRADLESNTGLANTAQSLALRLKSSPKAEIQDQLQWLQLRVRQAESPNERQAAEESLRQLRPETPAEVARVARLWFTLENWSQAELELARALADDALLPATRFELQLLRAQALARLQRYGEAQEAYALARQQLYDLPVAAESQENLSALILGSLQTEERLAEQAETQTKQALEAFKTKEYLNLRERLQAHPHSEEPRLSLTRIQLQAAMGSGPAALAELQRTRASLQQIQQRELLALWANTEMRLEQYKEAKALYAQLMRRYPQVRDYRREFAAAALLNQDWQLAYDNYAALLAQNPQDEIARLNLALLERQAGRRAESLALLQPLRAESFEGGTVLTRGKTENNPENNPENSVSGEESSADRAEEIIADMFQSQLLLTPEWDLSSHSRVGNAYMIFKGERIHMAQAETEAQAVWHTPQEHNLAQPDVQTRVSLGLSDYSELEPGVWEAFRQARLGLGLHYQNLARFPVRHLYLTPQINYVLTQPQISPVLQHIELKMAAGLAPNEDWGMELRGQLNLGQQNLLMGAFLNGILESQLNLYRDNLILGYTTGVHSYAIFDTQARQQDIFRWRNTFFLEATPGELHYKGEFDLSPVWGTLNDINLNTLQRVRYPLGFNFYAQAEAEAHHYFHPFQFQQSRALASLGLRWRLPLSETWPLYLGADLQGSWFYQRDTEWLPGFQLTLRSAL